MRRQKFVFLSSIYLIYHKLHNYHIYLYIDKTLRVGKMKLKKATAVKESDLLTFIGEDKLRYQLHKLNDPMSYVIEEENNIISFFQMELVEYNDYWLKKLFITQRHALKLPTVLQTIIQFAEAQKIHTIFVHSKQPVTDLLLSSFSFVLQSDESLLPFQLEEEGKWWKYTY